MRTFWQTGFQRREISALAIYLFFFLINLFIYLFFGVLGLRFCARAFSSCGEWGPLFIAVHGPLTIAASLVAEHRLQTCRLSSCGSRAQSLCGMWDLPRPGLEPVSPALAGRLSTTAPPGKPLAIYLLSIWPCSFLDLSDNGTCPLFLLVQHCDPGTSWKIRNRLSGFPLVHSVWICRLWVLLELQFYEKPI